MKQWTVLPCREMLHFKCKKRLLTFLPQYDVSNSLQILLLVFLKNSIWKKERKLKNTALEPLTLVPWTSFSQLIKTKNSFYLRTNWVLKKCTVPLTVAKSRRCKSQTLTHTLTRTGACTHAQAHAHNPIQSWQTPLGLGQWLNRITTLSFRRSGCVSQHCRHIRLMFT